MNEREYITISASMLSVGAGPVLSAGRMKEAMTSNGIDIADKVRQGEGWVDRCGFRLLAYPI